MRRLLSYGLLLLLVLVACAREELEQEWDGPVIELSLDCGEGMVTKAGSDGTESGVNAYRENLISSVDFYFYPGGAVDKNATYHIRKENLQNRNEATFRLEVTTNQVNSLIFPAQTKTTEATVLALVNVPKETLNSVSNTKLATLESLEVSTDFISYTDHRLPNFMMSGIASISLAGRSQKVVSAGIISVGRLASKVTVGVNVEEKVTIERVVGGETVTEIWRPRLEEMQIYLDGGVNTVALSGLPAGTEGGAAFDPEHPYYFSYNDYSNSDDKLWFFRKTALDEYEQLFDKLGDYYTTYPMYTYPHQWTNGEESEEVPDREPFLKLILPWEKELANGTTVTKPFYYKILFPKDRRGTGYEYRFVSNNWYHYNIEVGMLGADTEDAHVEISPISFYVFPWQNTEFVVKQAIIGRARYLSVERQYKVQAEIESGEEEPGFYSLNSLETVDVHYTSSNPIKFDYLSITRPYYGKQAVGTENVFGGAKICKVDEDSDKWIKDTYPLGTVYLEYPLNDSRFKLTDLGGTLRFEHALNNNLSETNFDYSPYTIIFSVQHADEGVGTKYAKTVKIVQYPGMYITAEENSDPQIINPATGKPVAGDDSDQSANSLYWKNYNHNGYTFVDGARRMRHALDDNGKDLFDGGEYGIFARTINADWYWGKNSTGHSVTDEQKNAAVAEVQPRLEWLQWRTLSFSGGNRNMYTIHVTVLPESVTVGKGKSAFTLQYILGDPRTLQPETWENGKEECSSAYSPTVPYYFDENNDLGYGEEITVEEGKPTFISFQKAPSIDNLDGAPRSLTWYYPADDSDRTKFMIAPSIRVASRFGGLEFYSGVSKQSAEFKCATYQEDGFPAGRWRLPTMAEIIFISSLSRGGNSSDFVALFGENANYWSANGAVKPNSGIQNVQQALARCVYDAWYWDQTEYSRLPAKQAGDTKDPRDQYVFGDMKIER